MLLRCNTLLLHCCCGSGSMFSLATRYLVPVRTSMSECGMPAECTSMGVPVALGKAMSSVLALRCTVVCCERVRYKRGHSRGLHSIHSRLPGLSYSHTTTSLLARSGPAGCLFALANHKDVLYQMHNKARFSVVLVFRIFAEIWSVIRQIHPCTTYINLALLFVEVPKRTPPIKKKLSHIVYYKYQQRSLQR